MEKLRNYDKERLLSRLLTFSIETIISSFKYFRCVLSECFDNSWFHLKFSVSFNLKKLFKISTDNRKS